MFCFDKQASLGGKQNRIVCTDLTGMVRFDWLRVTLNKLSVRIAIVSFSQIDIYREGNKINYYEKYQCQDIAMERFTMMTNLSFASARNIESDAKPLLTEIISAL